MNDEEIVRLLRERDDLGLSALVRRYGGGVRSVLRKQLGDVLDELERQAVLDEASAEVWSLADCWNPRRGDLRRWFCTIALNVGRMQARRKRGGPALTFVSLDALAAVADPRNPLQQKIVRADVAAGGTCSAEALARELGSTANSVCVQRSRARKALLELLREKGHEFG
jgi:DNA-directed RNA polymerase specialized sigma24 family protein